VGGLVYSLPLNSVFSPTSHSYPSSYLALPNTRLSRLLQKKTNSFLRGITSMHIPGYGFLQYASSITIPPFTSYLPEIC
jgi:hypothetical protein